MKQVPHVSPQVRRKREGAWQTRGSASEATRGGWEEGADRPSQRERHNSILFTISLLEKSIGPRSILLIKLN